MRGYDLTNQRFGRLIALYKCDKKKNHVKPWHCICDCGNEVDIEATFLVNGYTKSCGCLQREIASSIGKKTIKYAANIKINKLYEQKINHKFGKLLVLEREEDGKYLCLCDCGNYTRVRGYDLTSGNTQSCGCLKSKGEMYINQLLTKNNIPFETQKIFQNCKFPDTNASPIFDFYVNNSYIIEYDGIQHYEENIFFTESLERIKFKDNFKNEWCYENNIPLIRIPYWNLNKLKIEDLKIETSNFIIKNKK